MFVIVDTQTLRLISDFASKGIKVGDILLCADQH